MSMKYANIYMKRFRQIQLLGFALMLLAAFANPAKAQNASDIVRFVDITKGDQGYRNNGQTWATAKSDIQDAINTMHDYLEKNPNVTEAYVFVRGFDPNDEDVIDANGNYTSAKLTSARYYKPTESTETSETGTLFTSFKIYSGIHVYGGFSGKEELDEGETLVDLPMHRVLDQGKTIKKTLNSSDYGTQDPWKLKYQSVLSGNHGTAATMKWDASTNRYNSKFPSNSYHVVWFATNGEEYASTTGIQKDHYRPLEKPALLNGFKITGGYAASKETTNREHASMGGGVYMVGNATLSNCEIYNCEATLRGGGIYLDGGGQVRQCHVYQCQTLGQGIIDGYGGGVCVEYDGSVLKSYIERNVGRVGGGLAITYQEDNYPAAMKTKDGHPYKPYANTTIVSNNTATAEGGGVFLYGGGTLNQMTITRNKNVGQDVTYSGRRYGRSGGVYIDEIGILYNSVVWGNECAANNNIQYAAQNTNTSRTIDGKNVNPRVHYVALQANDVTNWIGTTHDNVYTLNKNNTPDSVSTNRYPYFTQPTEAAGVTSEVNPFYNWKPLAYTEIDMLGVQEQFSTDVNISTFLVNASTVDDIADHNYDALSTLGAFTKDREDFRGVLMASQYEKDGGKPIPTVFVDANRVVGQNADELAKTGTSWDFAVGSISKCISYFISHRTTSENKSTSRYKFTEAADGFNYEGQEVQILVKEGSYNNAGSSSYLTDDSGLELLSSASLRPCTGLRLIGGYSSELAGTAVDYRNPKSYPSRITGNLTNSTYAHNAFHVVALVNTSHTLIDGFILADGNANQVIRDQEAAEPNGGGVLVNNKMKWAQDQRDDMTDNVMRNCVVTNCTGTRRGGAIYVNGYYKKKDGSVSRVEFEMENCVINNNTTYRVQLADGKWDDGKGNSGTRQRFDLGGVVHANGNAKLTINHSTIVGNVGYGLSTSGYVEGQDEENEDFKKDCEIYINNSMIVSNCNVPRDSRSVINAPDMGEPWADGHTEQRRTEDGKLMNYATTIICPDDNIRGVNNYVDKGFVPDESCKLTQTYAVLGYDPSEDLTYCSFANPTVNIGAVENTNDITLYGGDPDWTPGDMHPVVNKAMVVPTNSDGSYKLDPATQYFVDATEAEVSEKTDLSTIAARNIGGRGDVGALENLSAKELGPIIHVRMPSSASAEGKEKYGDATVYNNVPSAGGSDANDGLSWSAPVETITHALELAKAYTTAHPGDTAQVWVAAGTFKENITLDATHSGINVYGGFKAYGNPTKKTNERDISNLIAEYQTIIDGDMKGRVLYQNADFGKSTMWEGFTIQNGINLQGVKSGTTDNEPAEDGDLAVTDTLTSEWSKGTYGKRIISYVKRTGGVTYTNQYNVLSGEGKYSSIGCGAYIMDKMILKNCLIRKNKMYGNPANGEFSVTRYASSATTRIQESKDAPDGAVTTTSIPGTITDNTKYYVYTPTRLDGGTAARVSGCGIYLRPGSVVENCIIRNNESFIKTTADNQDAWCLGVGSVADNATLLNSLIVENIGHGGSNQTGVAMLITNSQSKLYHCTIAYNQAMIALDSPTEDGRPACLPGVWDDYSGSYTNTEEYKNNKLSKFYNCVLWGNVANGQTGENFNPVGRSKWQSAIGKQGFFYNCYHSAPSTKFALEGTKNNNTEIDGEDGASKVFVTGTYENTMDVPDKLSSKYAKSYEDDYYWKCIAQNLFNEDAEDENGILKYPIVNGMSDNPYSINGSSTLAGYNINMGDDQWSNEMLQKYGIDQDIAGADRIQDCVVDKGAYEYNGSGDIKPEEQNNVEYVNANGKTGKKDVATYYVTWDGAGNTSAGSPATAACHEKLQKVLDAAGRYKYDHPYTQVIVKVAGADEGYFPSRTTDYDQTLEENPRDYSIQVPRGVEVWGGYNDREVNDGVVTESFTDRNILGLKTKFTGIFKLNGNSPIAYHTVTFTDYVFDENGDRIVLGFENGEYVYKKLSDLDEMMTGPNTAILNPQTRAVLDGIFIEDGAANGASADDQRGGACVVPDYAHIRNCVIQNNTAKSEGGGLYVKPWSLVSGTIIQNNTADKGAGVYVEERTTADGKPLYSDKESPLWTWLVSNTVVNNTANTSGGGIYFGTNVRSLSSVFWHNSGNDMPNVSGATDTGEEQSIDNYPFSYSAVQDTRLPGVNNIELSPTDTHGTRWVADDKIKTEDKVKDPIDNKVYTYFNIMKSSVLVRAGLPYSSYEALRQQMPSLELRDINGVARMAEEHGEDEHPMTLNKSEELINKDNSFIEIGARALNETFELDPKMIMTRLYVAHTNVMNTDAASAFQTLGLEQAKDGETDKEKAEREAHNEKVKFYRQLGSSFANPFTRFDDALRYIIDARKNYSDKMANSPQSFVKGQQRVRDVRFEIYLTAGTYYPNFEQFGSQGNTRNNTFLIPEKVTVVGGTQLGLDDDGEKATQFYCQDKTAAATGDDSKTHTLVLEAGAYKLYGENTNVIRNNRPHYDLNHNAIVEPWEMEHQSILSGKSSSGLAKNVYHVVTISGDPNLVGAQPTRFKEGDIKTDDAGNILLDWDETTRQYTENQNYIMADDESYDKMEALNEDKYAGKESVKSLNTRDVFLDGLTITNGYAAEFSDEENPNRNDFFRGGGVLVNGNKYVKNGDTYAGWDSEADAMEMSDRLIHLNVANCEFLGNTAYQGGAIFSNGNVVITSSSFQQNQTLGVSSDGVDKNYVTYCGGGAVAVSGRFNAANTLFANNEASRGDYDITHSFSETVNVDGNNMTYTRPANNGNYANTKLVKHAMADVIHGFGGALWGNDLSKVVTVNCNFVRNKAFAFPAVFVTHNNAEWKGYFTDFKDIAYVRHYAANTLFWGNDISATKALDTDKLEDYYYGFNSWYTNRPGTEIQAMYFCAYPEGRGPEASENADHERSYYQNMGYTEKVDLWETMGEANHSIILSLNNDALDGPNFIQPSTVAGVAGYTPSANWLTYRINSLVDNGWTALKLNDNGDFVFEKDEYGAASTTDAYPDVPDDAVASGASQGDNFKEGDYLWRARLFKQLSGLDMLAIGNQKYMYYAKADGSENEKRQMLRVSKDAISRTGKAYIDIGVYEYQHAQLNIADGDDVDVIWVAEREDPFNGNDGRTFDTPTSDLQRAIEMLLLTRCDHKKEVRIKEGTYSPIYQLDDGVYGFNIHLGANENNIALRSTVNAGQPYGIQSLTIKGGYSNFAEDDYDPETHPVTLQMTDHGGAAAGRMAHLFYIYDAEQWTTTPSSAGHSTDGAAISSKDVTKASEPMHYALPITFEGLTFNNPYAMANSNTGSGSAIYYKDQYTSVPKTGGIKEYVKTTTPLGEALHVGYSYTGESTDENGVRTVTGEQLITPETAAKLTVKNCIFLQNGADGATSIPAIHVGKGGGEAIIVNSLFHSNTGAPVVGADTKVINCTMALNGGHTQLTNSGITYNSVYGKVQNYNDVIVNPTAEQKAAAGYTALGPNTYVSELHNSLIWKDDAAASTQYATQFEVQDGANTLTQNSTFTEDGVVTYNGVLGLKKDGKLVIDADKTADRNIGLSENNTDAASGPNFQDPENAIASQRNFHVNPSIAVMSKADNKTYVVKAMRMKDPSATEVEEALKEKTVDGKDASERELSNLLRLYGPGMERGAYECTAYLQRVYYVNPQRGEGAGERNGVRWASAYGAGQLQTAIDAAGVYSALNGNAYAYVFVKANTNDNTVGENIIMRDGVVLIGSLPVSFYDEAVATVDKEGNITEYTDDNIDEYEYKVLASRDGIATKGAAHTNIRGIEAYDSEYYTGCFVDGFVVKPAPGDEAHEIPPVAINDNNKVYIRNCVITGFRMTGNYPVVAIRGGILYNSLVFGNTIDPYQRDWTQVLFAGSNGYVVNCTVVAENTGEMAVGARADVNQDNGLYKHVINTVTYNNADNSLARVTVSAEENNKLDPDFNKAYINCNEKVGMFAPYFHTSPYAPARMISYEPYWYQLHENSECIDAGMDDEEKDANGYYMEDYVANGMNVPLWYNIELHQDRDILGNPRIIGKRVDIGCFETWKIADDSSVLFSKDTNTEPTEGILTKDGYLIDQDDNFILDAGGNKIVYTGDPKQDKAVPGIVKYSYTDNFGGRYYPHPGSVTYVGKNANIILDEGDFTYGEAFRPGYLLMKKGASFYGNKGIVGIEYMAVETDVNQGFTIKSFPYAHKWGDIEITSYDAETDKLTENCQASHVEGAWTYNGEKRSEWNYSFATDNSPCWENLEGETQMPAVDGYLMKFDEAIADLRFTGYSETDALLYAEEGYDKTFTLTQYNATETVSLTDENSTRNYPHFTSEQNMGWNIKGNPYLVYTYKTYESETTAGGMERYALHIPHVVYGILPSGSFGSYKSWEHRDADVPTLGVGFFAQTAVLGGTGATEVVTVKQPIWETTPSPTPAKGYYAVSIGSNEQTSDEVIFDAVAESSAARSLNYSYGRDALKLTAFDENIPQLWMQNDEGTPISLASAAPRETPITLGMRIPSSGDYTFKAMAPSEQEDSTSLDAIWLIDREENIAFDLMQGSYTAKVAAAEDSDEPTINTNRFALQLGGARPGMKQIAKKAHGFYVKQHILHITNTKAGEKIAIYAASGVLLRRAEATAGEYSTQLLPGVYIVKINDESFKVLVK